MAQPVGALIFRARSLQVTGVQSQNKAEKATEQCLWKITQLTIAIVQRYTSSSMRMVDWLEKQATCGCFTASLWRQHDKNVTKKRKEEKSEQHLVFVWQQLLQWNGTTWAICTTYGPRSTCYRRSALWLTCDTVWLRIVLVSQCRRNHVQIAYYQSCSTVKNDSGITIQWKTCRARVSVLHPGYVLTLPQKPDHNTSKTQHLAVSFHKTFHIITIWDNKRRGCGWLTESKLIKNWEKNGECSSLEEGYNGVSGVPQKLIRQLTVV
jgi:hypothetical protein